MRWFINLFVRPIDNDCFDWLDNQSNDDQEIIAVNVRMYLPCKCGKRMLINTKCCT